MAFHGRVACMCMLFGVEALAAEIGKGKRDLLKCRGIAE